MSAEVSMRLLLMTLGCGGVFFGGQQGEEFGDDSGHPTDSGGGDDSGDRDTADDLELVEGVYNGSFQVNAVVSCVGTLTLETDGWDLGGTAECGDQDYTIEGTLGSATLRREDGSSWALALEIPDDQTLLGSFSGDDSSGVATEGEFEALFDGD
jgi:hypothetical protein